MTQQVPTKPIGAFLDYTYCASPGCQNECGRKMTKEVEDAINKIEFHRVAMSYFCGGDS